MSFLRNLIAKLIPFDETRRCGIWPLVIDDPAFKHACYLHDKAYEDAKREDDSVDRELIEKADRLFKKRLWIASEGDMTKRFRARIYYTIASAWRRIRTS